MLRHESILVARGASFALQSMLVSGGLRVEDWESLVPHFTSAWHDAEADATRRTVLTDLCAALPPPVQSQIRNTCRVEAEPPTGPQVWSRSRRSAHYGFARSIAGDACARRGHHEEPLLERLLFEAMFDPRGVRMSTSACLRRCLPVCPRPGAAARRRKRSRTGRGEPVRRAAGSPCVVTPARSCRLADPLLESGETTEFELAVMIVGRSGRLAAARRHSSGGCRETRRQCAGRSMLSPWPRTHDWRTSRRIVVFRSRHAGAPGGGWISVVGSWSERERLPHPRTGSHSPQSRRRGRLGRPRAAREMLGHPARVSDVVPSWWPCGTMIRATRGRATGRPPVPRSGDRTRGADAGSTPAATVGSAGTQHDFVPIRRSFRHKDPRP